MAEVVIYSSWMCPFCYRAKEVLKRKSVDFDEIIVDMRPGVRAEMREKSGGLNTVPQIFIDGAHYGGCNELLALDASGELDRLLGLQP